MAEKYDAPIKRVEFAVEFTDPATGELRALKIRVRPADRIRCEQLARKYGIQDSHAEAHVALWTWAALAREGEFTGTYHEYVDALEDYEAIRDVPVDPTRPATTGESPSNSPTGSPEPSIAG